MKKTSLTRHDLENFAANELSFYGLDISRISSIFIAQIIQLETSRSISTFSILDEVKFLEGIRKQSSSQAASTFKKEPLKGLMKKHFTNARFILKNLGAHFGYEFGGNKKLDTLISKAFEQNTLGHVDEAFANYLAYEGTVEALRHRAKHNKMTGEWIVFQQHNGKNYYLTLASHTEEDETIYERVCDAYTMDFKFLNK